MENIDYTKNNSKVWEEIKKAFCNSPEEALKSYSLDRKYIEDKIKKGSDGHSWFVGNCVITRECIKAVVKLMGLREVFCYTKCDDKKHDIEFKIGTAKCHFNGGRAKATCFAENKELIKKFFNFFYPEEYTDIQ